MILQKSHHQQVESLNLIRDVEYGVDQSVRGFQPKRYRVRHRLNKCRLDALQKNNQPQPSLLPIVRAQ